MKIRNGYDKQTRYSTDCELTFLAGPVHDTQARHTDSKTKTKTARARDCVVTTHPWHIVEQSTEPREFQTYRTSRVLPCCLLHLNCTHKRVAYRVTVTVFPLLAGFAAPMCKTFGHDTFSPPHILFTAQHSTAQHSTALYAKDQSTCACPHYVLVSAPA